MAFEKAPPERSSNVRIALQDHIDLLTNIFTCTRWSFRLPVQLPMRSLIGRPGALHGGADISPVRSFLTIAAPHLPADFPAAGHHRDGMRFEVKQSEDHADRWKGEPQFLNPRRIVLLNPNPALVRPALADLTDSACPEIAQWMIKTRPPEFKLQPRPLPLRRPVAEDAGEEEGQGILRKGHTRNG